MVEKRSAREKRSIRTKQAILETAQQIIAEQGAEGLSMRELAHRIDYSPSGLYEYFSSKEEILAAVCDEGFRQLTAALEHTLSTLSPVERLIEAAQVYLEFAIRHPELYLLMFVQKSDDHNALIGLRDNSAFGCLRQIIQDGLTDGIFTARPGYGLAEMTYGAWSLVHGMSMLRLTLHKAAGTEVDELHHRIVAGFVTNL